MIGIIKWLVRKCPNVLVLFAGVWLAWAPWAFVLYVEDATETGVPAGGLLAVLYPFQEPINIALCVVDFLGCGIALAAVWRMLRPWLYPR